MSTVTSPYPLVLDPQAYAGIHLIESDGEPMETILHRDCMFLLIELVKYKNRGRTDFLAGGDNFIYFNPDQARNLDYRGPDFFYIKDGVAQRPLRQYWAVWEEGGRLPDVIIELTSPTTEEVDRTTKFAIYEQTLRTPEYFLYDPFALLLEGWRLVGEEYQALTPNERGWLWSEELQAWLGAWKGVYLLTPSTYLRLYDAAGELILMDHEDMRLQANEAQRRADEEQQRAVQAERQVKKERQQVKIERRHAEKAQQQAEQARQQADQQRQRAEEAERELARLKALLEQHSRKSDAKDDANP